MLLNLRNLILLVTLFLAVDSQAQLELDFSEARGFYNSSTNLVITASDPSAIIRYTLDGEEPSPSSGTIFNGSLDLTTTAIVRAIGYIPGIDTTKVYTHTYIFINDVILQSETIDGWPNTRYNLGSGNATARHDYEMDPNIVTAPEYSEDLLTGLLAIPSLSIVMPQDDFWTMYDGDSEKKTSIELLYANDPNLNEQVDGGIEPHSHKRLKRSMRLSFKKEYGKANWDSDIFKNARVGSDQAADRFDRIVLRGGNNRAWSRNWNQDRTAFTRDEWFRQSQLAASGIGARGTFVHLYVNGLYWGLYNPVERPDESFTSTYLGGEKEDWFAISHGGDQGGDDSRYDFLMNNILNNDLSQSNNYEELMRYLDVSKFCDYVLLSWMTGVQDWPGNNWWGGNRTNPAGQYMYFGWDNEWSWDVTRNGNNGAWVHPDFRSNDQGGRNSALVFNRAKVNEDFMILFADRVYKLVFNNGALTDDNSRLRWSTLNEVIEDAVVAESARWGDSLEDGITRTRDEHWGNEVERLDGLMDGNVERLMAALKEENYYPDLDPPLYEMNSTVIEVQELSIPDNNAITLINPNGSGDIYYTLDGSDPRLSGGAIAASAILYTTGAALDITQSVTLNSRVLNGNTWSALHCLNLFAESNLDNLKLTEIMYHPQDLGEVSGTELEFIELKNTSTTQSADLSGVRASDGLDFEFPMGTMLGPQEFIVLASNAAELLAKCPGIDIFDEYEGQLRNSGETIEFVSFLEDTIIRVDYNDRLPWPLEADGEGPSLVTTSTNPVGDQDDASFWTISADNFYGSPGRDEPSTSVTELNEDLTYKALIYPNPGAINGTLIVESEEVIVSVELHEATGKRELLNILNKQPQRIEFKSPTTAGLYILTIHYRNGSVLNKSFVVK